MLGRDCRPYHRGKYHPPRDRKCSSLTQSHTGSLRKTEVLPNWLIELRISAVLLGVSPVYKCKPDSREVLAVNMALEVKEVSIKAWMITNLCCMFTIDTIIMLLVTSL